MPTASAISTSNPAQDTTQANAQRVRREQDDAQASHDRFMFSFGTQLSAIAGLQQTIAGDGVVEGQGMARADTQASNQRRASYADPLGLAVREELTTPAEYAQANPGTERAAKGDQGTQRQAGHPTATPSSNVCIASQARGDDMQPDQSHTRDENNNQQPRQSSDQNQTRQASLAQVPTGPRAQEPGQAKVEARVGSVAGAAASASQPQAKADAQAVVMSKVDAFAKLKSLGMKPRAAPQRPVLQEQIEEKASAQVTRGLASILRKGGGTTLIRLQPDALGAVRVQLNLSDSRVQAKVEASTEQARDLLMKDISTLRAALEGKGMEVDDIEVTLDPRLAERAKRGGNASGDAPRQAGHASEDPSHARTPVGDHHQNGGGAHQEREGGASLAAHAQRRGSTLQETEDPDPTRGTSEQAAKLGTGTVLSVASTIRLDAVV